MDNKNNDRLPEVHDALRELRAAVDAYPDHRVLIGETYTENFADLVAMFGKKNDELQLPMNFFFAFQDKLSAAQYRKEIALWDANPAGGWPVYLFSNHDRTRAFSRYADGKHDDQIAKLLATMLLTLRGTPILYYGEELGMKNSDPKRKEDVKDPIGIFGWPEEKGRDGERTPMQWDATSNAGFSTAGKTWLPVAADFAERNVQSERKDPNSVLNYYKQLGRLRRSAQALSDGSYVALNENDNNVLSYLRKGKDNAVIVALNMSDTPQKLQLDVKKLGFAKTGQVLLSSFWSEPTKLTAEADLENLSLPAYGSLLIKLK
jgi:alpha-glucosidase